MPCSPRRSKACLWVTQREWNANMQLEGQRKNEQRRIKQPTLKKEKINDCSTQQCQRLWFSQAIHHALLINSWHWFSVERFLLWFHTRFYQNYYGLYWINQQDQSARDANKKENASLSSEVALLIKVQSHSQKLQQSQHTDLPSRTFLVGGPSFAWCGNWISTEPASPSIWKHFLPSRTRLI